MKKAVFLIIVICTLLSLQVPTRAGWVDDWLQQKVESSPGYFEGQKRGYVTGGSFSARWHPTTDYPVTLMLPKVKVGCGGIDAFMGGFSFLNFEYLVQKLQNILQAAPAYAFDMALSTLCQQCSTIMKDFEALADRLNSIQISTCASSKSLVYAARDIATRTSAIGEKLGEAWSNFSLREGLSNIYQRVVEQFRSSNDNPPSNASNQLLQGCSNDIKTLFAQQGSVLEKEAAKLGLDANFVDIARGLVGDIKIEQQVQDGRTDLAVKIIPPCAQNKKANMEDLLHGEMWAKAGNEQCYQIQDVNRNIVDYVSQKISRIASRMKARMPLDASDQAFINSNPTGVWMALRTSIGTDQESVVGSLISELTARAYVYRMLSDIYTTYIAITEKIDAAVENQASGSSSGSHQCAVGIIGSGLENLDDMKHSAYQLVLAAANDTIAVTSQVNTLIEFAQKMKSFEEMARREVFQRFGAGITERVFSKAGG